MEFGDWLTTSGFMLLQSIGIVGSLLFTAFALRAENKTRRISNVLAVTGNHREIWTEIFNKPGLQRVLDAEADLEKSSLSREEQVFVNLVILHLNSVFHAMKDKLVLQPDGLHKDIGWFFALPIPQSVWHNMKLLHEDEFVQFVESCLPEKPFLL